MDLSNWINLGLLGVTAVSVWVAILQAKHAAEANEKAAGHETRALAASESAAASAAEAVAEHRRAADALTRQAEAAEAALPRKKWSIERLSAERWKVTNRAGENVDFVTIGGRPDGYLQVEGSDLANVGDGQSLYFYFGGGQADPASLTVKIAWRGADGTGHEEFHTIP
jgi:hypothetical protein